MHDLFTHGIVLELESRIEAAGAWKGEGLGREGLTKSSFEIHLHMGSEVWGSIAHANYPDLIIIQPIHGSEQHTIPHKYAQF